MSSAMCMCMPTRMCMRNTDLRADVPLCQQPPQSTHCSFAVPVSEALTVSVYKSFKYSIRLTSLRGMTARVRWVAAF